MSSPTTSRLNKRKSESSADGSRSRSRAKVLSSKPPGDTHNIIAHEAGRAQVFLPASLRSILMSPTSFTLFRGFHPTADHSNITTNRVIASIDGLPADFLDFTFFHEGNRELRTVFSESCEAAATATAGKMVEMKGKAAEEDALQGEPLLLINHAGHDGKRKKEVNAADTTAVMEEMTTVLAEQGYAPQGKVEDAEQQLEKFTNIHKESRLAAHLRSKLNNGILSKSMNCVARTNEAGLDNDNEGEKVDSLMFMSKDQEGQSQGSDCVKDGVPPPLLLGLVEFGWLDMDSEQNLTNDDMKEMRLEQKLWETFDQATNYLGTLRSDDDSSCSWKKWEKSLLLGVFVATRDCTMVRCAVFVCEPKGAKDWRMALMWRSHQRKSTADLSEAFGFYLNAVNYLAEHLKELADKEIMWEYLGPHCTKVSLKKTKFIGPDSTKTTLEPYVLRSYDNRGWHTSRGPQVYKRWKRLADTTIVITFIQESDDSDTLDFGADYEGNLLHDDKSQLVSKQNDYKEGKVEVIAVPYVVGTHECTSIIHLVSLVHFLDTMHTANLVHGDVRGFNTVFLEVPKGLKASDILAENNLTMTDLQYAIDFEENKVPQDQRATKKTRDLKDFLKGFNFACLIDFDYGGHVDNKLKYPDGYNALLMDGRRNAGMPGLVIKQHHDVAAAAQVLDLHELTDLQTSSAGIVSAWYRLIRARDFSQMLLNAMKLLLMIPDGSVRAEEFYKRHLDLIEEDS